MVRTDRSGTGRGANWLGAFLVALPIVLFAIGIACLAYAPFTPSDDQQAAWDDFAAEPSEEEDAGDEGSDGGDDEGEKASRTQAKGGLESTREIRYDERFRPYYALLSDDHKKVYEQVAEGLYGGSLKVEVDEEVGLDDFKNIVSSMMSDQPELFWITGGYTVRTTEDDVVEHVEFTPNSKHDDLDAAMGEIGAVLDEVGSSAPDDEYELALYLHDQVASLATYEDDAEDQGQNAYNALVEGETVCEGYARAYQLVSLSNRLPTYLIEGEAQGSTGLEDDEWVGHAWNVVELGDDLYNVDVTWDDGSLDGSEDGYKYSYYGLSEDSLASDHKRNDLSSRIGKSDGDLDFEKVYGEDAYVASLEASGYDDVVVLDSISAYEDDLYDRLMSAKGADFDYVMVLYAKDGYEKTDDVWDGILRKAADAGMSSGYQRKVTYMNPTDEVLVSFETYQHTN